MGEPRVPGRRWLKVVRARPAGLVALALPLAACGATRAPRAAPVSPMVVTTAPATWPSGAAMASIDAEAALRTGLIRSKTCRVVSAASQLSTEVEGCAEDNPCLIAAGRRTGARKLTQVRLATLGTTTLVRVVVFDLARGTQEQTRQELVREGDVQSVSDAIARAAELLARTWAPPPPEPEPTAWFESGWLWGGVGAAVLGGAAIAVGAAASGADGTTTTETERPDVTLTPP